MLVIEKLSAEDSTLCLSLLKKKKKLGYILNFLEPSHEHTQKNPS